MSMKVVSFNVNSIRQRLHQLQALVDNHAPEFIGLQETKVTDEDFPLQAVEALGYHVAFFGQKTHYGVALLSKYPFLCVTKGYDNDRQETQRRFISAKVQLPDGKALSLINGYFPQGESQEHPVKFPNKQAFYADLLTHLQKYHRADEPLIVMGDMNVAPEDKDIGIGEDNRKRWLKAGKCSFLPIERQWLQSLSQWGLVDTFRHTQPETIKYSWFDYRSRGFEREPRRGLRIDLILVTAPLLTSCQATGIDYDIRGMEKPSDHCPIWAEFS